jgi:uncharacterized protein YkwD
MKLKYLAIVAAVFSLSLLGYSVTAANTQAAADGQDIVALANADRAANGVPPLVVSQDLTLAANLKLDDMVQNAYFAHVSPQGVSPWYFIRRSGYVYQSAGENLAMNFDTSAKVEAAWMGSPEHRANILNPAFTEVGIAERSVVYEGQRTNFVVEEFGQPAQ